MFDIKRFAALESRVDDQLHQFSDDAYADDRRKKGALAGAGLAATAVGGGVYLSGKKPQIAAGINRAKTAIESNKAVAKEAGRTAVFRGMRGTASVINKGGNMVNRVAKKSGAGLTDEGLKLGKVLKKGAKVLKKNSMAFFSRGEAGVIIELASRIKAIELAAEEELIEFKDYGSQRDPALIQQVGQSTGGFLGGREALMARDKFSSAGHVYRKRDAAADSLKGSLAATGLTVGGIAGGVLGSRALIKGAASGKIPKGVLRKGAVKAAQVLKKAGRSKAIAAGSLGAGAIAGGVGGAALQRRSANQRLAKRQSND